LLVHRLAQEVASKIARTILFGNTPGENMAKKAKKKSITTTAKGLAKNFGKLAVDVQRVALMEMVAVYERAASATKKASKKAKKAKKTAKKR